MMISSVKNLITPLAAVNSVGIYIAKHKRRMPAFNVIAFRLYKVLTWALIYALVASNAFGASSLAPPIFEDGTQVFTRWFTNSRLMSSPEFKGIELALAKYGIRAQNSGKDYDWTHDILFFDQAGQALIMPEFSSEVLRTGNLTLGVFDNDAYELTEKVSKSEITSVSKYKKLKDVFLEGGAVITGQKTNGEPYLIAPSWVLELTLKNKFEQTGKHISRMEAFQLISKDLNIPVSNLIFLPLTTGHLDTYMMALPGQRILLHDPSKIKDVLKAYKLTELQRFYEQGIGNSSFKRFPQELEYFGYESAIRVLSGTQNILEKHGFKVRRVAGRFETIYSINNQPYSFESTVNFFNGFSGKAPNGEIFNLTNKSSEYPELESYWTSVLEEEGFQKENIHFVGSYRSGAGLDCSGSIAP